MPCPSKTGRTRASDAGPQRKYEQQYLLSFRLSSCSCQRGQGEQASHELLSYGPATFMSWL